jgi:hypothetical protein
VKCYIWSITLYIAETSESRSEMLGKFVMWCWRRTKKISWIDRVRNEEVLRGVNEERNILHAVKRRKTNWIGHILRRNRLLNVLY